MKCVSRLRLCVATGLVAASCAGCAPSVESAHSSETGQSASAPSQTSLLLLDLVYTKPAVVGGSVRATVAGLSPGKTVVLSWGTVSGGWVIEDYYHFRGKKYSESTTKLGQFTVDGSGRLDAQFDVPEDFGGVHEVTALVRFLVPAVRRRCCRHFKRKP